MVEMKYVDSLSYLPSRHKLQPGYAVSVVLAAFLVAAGNVGSLAVASRIAVVKSFKCSARSTLTSTTLRGCSDHSVGAFEPVFTRLG